MSTHSSYAGPLKRKLGREFHACMHVCVLVSLRHVRLDLCVSVAEMIRFVYEGWLVVLDVNAIFKLPEHEDAQGAIENACDEIVRTGLCKET